MRSNGLTNDAFFGRDALPWSIDNFWLCRDGFPHRQGTFFAGGCRTLNLLFLRDSPGRNMALQSLRIFIGAPSTLNRMEEIDEHSGPIYQRTAHEDSNRDAVTHVGSVACHRAR